jgi:hypothetical protein
MATAVEDVLKLQGQFETARRTAIEALVSQIKTAQESLKVLGYEAPKARPKKTTSRKPCAKCNATDHDARFHRGAESAGNSK